ncbi:MAG: radical SAM peptide maturase, CXXX-repeat target family [Firmicutes bacterium]|nr:radical SAM peptide maturase, CXXX-repeat target family [Bacillota bacterium]
MRLMSKINFGKMPLSFHNFSVESGCNDITLSVTEECNLRCKYCYLTYKNCNKKMSFEIAKKAVDYIIATRDVYNEKSVVWNFIGGEPLLEIDLIDKISDYIKLQMYLTNHLWFDNYMFCIGTNGILYNTEKVQDYIKKNKSHLTVIITIDGNKIKHDLQRVYPDGRGSYDDVVKNVPLWLSQFEGATTKATFSREDIPYLKDSIIHLWNLGIKQIPANVIFEDVWQKGDEDIFESQLKELADYVIENDIFLDPEYSVQFFDPFLGLPMTSEDKQNKYCGSGKMLAVDCEGKFFPCMRFTDFSMSKKKIGLRIGDITKGLDKDKLRPFEQLSIGKMNNEKCENCKIATGCRTCVGFCYDDSKEGSIFNRTIYHCEMQKANVRAVEYFWDKVSSKLDDSENPRKLAIKNFNKKFGNYLIIYTTNSALPHCSYSNSSIEKLDMSEDVLKDVLKFAENAEMTPVIVGRIPKDIDKDYFKINEDCDSKSESILVITDENICKDVSKDICIMHVNREKLASIAEKVETVFKAHSSQRVNIILHDIHTFSENDKVVYEEQLFNLANFLVENSDKNFYLNVFDPAFLPSNKHSSCDCGIDTFAVMPNGKLYLCPGMYFHDETLDVGDIKNGFNISQKSLDIFKAEFRCIYLNKKLTGEYNIEPKIIEEIIQIEKKVSNKLKEMLAKKRQLARKEVDSI